MKKFISSLLLAALLFCTFNSPMVYAACRPNTVDLEKKIRAVVNKYEGYEVVELKDVEGVIDTDRFFKLNSVNELDQLLRSFKKSAKKKVRVEVSPNGGSSVTMPSTGTSDIVPFSYTGVQTQTEWAPLYLYGLGAPLTVWKMCTIEYHWDYNSYGYRIFTSIDRITSDIVGVFIGNGWVQTGASANIVYGGLGADVVVHGYGYIGIDIKGYPTAIRIPDTWYWYFTMSQH